RFCAAMYPSILAVLRPIVGVSRLSSWRLDERGRLAGCPIFPCLDWEPTGSEFREVSDREVPLASRVLSQSLHYELTPILELLGPKVSRWHACARLPYAANGPFSTHHSSIGHGEAPGPVCCICLCIAR